ncbi:MAG: hypothetical protein WA089_18830, partial [Anaerolineae bacterium]
MQRRPAVSALERLILLIVLTVIAPHALSRMESVARLAAGDISQTVQFATVDAPNTANIGHPAVSAT